MDDALLALRNVKHGEKYPVYAMGAEPENSYELKRLKPEWLTHEPQAIGKDGKPIAVGQTVYYFDNADYAYEVVGVGGSVEYNVRLRGEGGVEHNTNSGKLVHEKPRTLQDVPPEMDTVVSMNTDLARDLKAAEEERDMWRERCGRMKDAACELLRVSES